MFIIKLVECNKINSPNVNSLAEHKLRDEIEYLAEKGMKLHQFMKFNSIKKLNWLCESVFLSRMHLMPLINNFTDKFYHRQFGMPPQ